ncbi:MAG: lipase maturation factor family protein [Acidobacteriota bacterium]|nr:lipase maturation factor family protein [Acidobacteriota bacterium]
MEESLKSAVFWLLGPETLPGERTGRGHLWARWIFLRALAVIYFSAFYSFFFQIKGLIGPSGILPAVDYLQAVAAQLHSVRYWFAPTLLWFGASDHALMAVCWVGSIASALVFFNLWPRASLAVCFICFLSCIAAAQDFANYQSDGMLLAAGFLSLFLAATGIRPGLGRVQPPSRASQFLLLWIWFRIYFESGVVKILSGDRSWRNFTAMDDYYQNSPLPTWIGWYVQHLPHWFHAATVGLMFAVELVICWATFLPRRFRIVCFWIVTPFQVCIILTGNYAFLNYIVLSLAFLLLDDQFVEWAIPRRIRALVDRPEKQETAAEPAAPVTSPVNGAAVAPNTRAVLGIAIAGFCMLWIFYVTSAKLLWMFSPNANLPKAPVEALEPFRIANQYGLFAVMTHTRYEIEFQGSQDGSAWTAYPFRYKPQNPAAPPGIYAPYQPRFEWNLWFASLGSWPQYRFVVWTEERLLSNDSDVLQLFAENPFGSDPPKEVRAVIYQYWFTSMKAKHETGMWWKRQLLGMYAPSLARQPDGKIVVLDNETANPPPP